MVPDSSWVARIGLLWRGERRADRPLTRGDTLLPPLSDALAELNVFTQPVVYSDDAIEEVREELLQLDGVLVWVNPIQDGSDRMQLDALLREAASQGIWVSAHPDAILSMGTKEVLARTRTVGWGTDSHIYETAAHFRHGFPGRLAADHVRVLKQLRGNGGQGVWKVELADPSPAGNPATQTLRGDTPVRVQHADKRDDSGPTKMPLGQFMDSCDRYFANAGRLIDQAFQTRLEEGMVRCYLVQDEVVGFCHQWPTGLLPPSPKTTDTATNPPSVMEPPATPGYQALKTKMEREWVPQMRELLDIDATSMPAIWDADFLYGPKTATGGDTYVLCEINVSAVWPYPETANQRLATVALAGTSAAKAARSRH